MSTNPTSSQEASLGTRSHNPGEDPTALPIGHTAPIPCSMDPDNEQLYPLEWCEKADESCNASYPHRCFRIRTDDSATILCLVCGGEGPQDYKCFSKQPQTITFQRYSKDDSIWYKVTNTVFTDAVGEGLKFDSIDTRGPDENGKVFVMLENSGRSKNPLSRQELASGLQQGIGALEQDDLFESIDAYRYLATGNIACSLEEAQAALSSRLEKGDLPVNTTHQKLKLHVTMLRFPVGSCPQAQPQGN